MDFFGQQELAERNSRRLMVLFLIGIVVALLLVYPVGLALYLVASVHSGGALHGAALTKIFITVATITVSVVGVASWYKMSQLSAGGSVVARLLGARRITGGVGDAKERQILNIVEEMAIASSLPVPEVYVMDGETAINAMAAGMTPSDAVVVLTQGALEKLDRDELQGVVAHEFSHILYGDMTLNLRMMGLLHGLLVVGLAGKFLLRTDRILRGRPVLFLVGLGIVLWLLGFSTWVTGKVIKASLSRQREFLADAAAVQFTRNRAGISGALRKIAEKEFGSVVGKSSAAEMSHFFFAEAFWENLDTLLETHPSIAERLRRLGEPALIPVEHRPMRPVYETRAETPAAAPVAAAAALHDQVIAPEPLSPTQSAEILAAIPRPLREATTHPLSSVALVFSILAQSSTLPEGALEDALEPLGAAQVLREIDQLAPTILGLDPRLRLPLVDLAIPSLRQLSPEQHRMFILGTSRIVKIDGQMSLFELCLMRVLRRHLDWPSSAAGLPRRQYRSLRPVAGECSLLLSALAWVGDRDADRARKSFQVGVARLPSDLVPYVPWVDLQACSTFALDGALDALDLLGPALKAQLVQACTHTVTADGKVSLQEADLLRAVVEALGCPIPPLPPSLISSAT